MENNPTPPASRTFCVWADRNRRVYQEVDAASPEEAYRLAKENPGGWQPCFEHEGSGYRLSNDVRDVETDETFTVGVVNHCKTCGSEIVETVNESAFREGECGPCEYRRYRSQPALLAACKGVTGLIYRDKRDTEQIDFNQYEAAERACEAAVTSTQHEHAA